MFKKETGEITNDARIHSMEDYTTAGETMSDGSMDYLAKSNKQREHDVRKIKKHEIKY